MDYNIKMMDIDEYDFNDNFLVNDNNELMDIDDDDSDKSSDDENDDDNLYCTDNKYELIKSNNETEINIKLNYIDLILKELNDSEFSYLISNKYINKIYLIRFYVFEKDTYLYKIGYTTDIESRLRSINHQYNSCGRIILIFCGEIISSVIERKIHKNLEIYKYNHIICGKKAREIYHINSQLYDDFNNTLLEFSNNYFESSFYVINDNNTEELCVTNRELENIKKDYTIYCEKYNLNIDQSIFIQNNINPHIVLNKNIIEKFFWVNFLIF
jgi:hypothetical protein